MKLQIQPSFYRLPGNFSLLGTVVPGFCPQGEGNGSEDHSIGGYTHFDCVP
jgi:hypothetical protein